MLIDIRAVALGSYRGAANLSALGVPPTGAAPEDYFIPLQDWLVNFEVDTGTQKVRPYNPDIAAQLAEMVRAQWPDQIPTDDAELKRSFGYGWWKQDVQAATELLQKAGFTKNGNQWMQPDGTPFEIRMMVEGDAIPTLASLPRIGDISTRKSLVGKPPSLANPPSGCRFHPRCPIAINRCSKEVPEMLPSATGGRVACFRAGEVAVK